MWKPVYYADHAERYAHLSEDERKQYPDEIEFLDIDINHHLKPTGRRWRRTKKLSEMTVEDRRRYGPDGVAYAAVDIRLCDAEVWH